MTFEAVTVVTEDYCLLECYVCSLMDRFFNIGTYLLYDILPQSKDSNLFKTALLLSAIEEACMIMYELHIGVVLTVIGCM
jgi:hypothetical protein